MGTFLFTLIGLFVVGCCLHVGYISKWNKEYFFYVALSILIGFDLLFCNKHFGAFDALTSFSLAFTFCFFVFLLLSCIKNLVLHVVVDFSLLLLSSLPIYLKCELNLPFFSEELLISLYQTNLDEVGDFLKDVVSLSIIVVLICVFSLLIYINLHKVRIFSKAMLMDFVLLGLIICLSYSYCSSVYLIRKSFQSYGKLTDAFREKDKLDYAAFKYAGGDVSTLIVVIGESACRDYMSAYGYANKTTPNLDELLADSIMLKLYNSYSSEIKTIKSIPEMLTAKNQFSACPFYNIIDILNMSGWETFWLSNQKKMGSMDTPVSVIAKNAKHQRYRPLMGGYDGDLLPLLENALKSKTSHKFIVLHLMGSHLPASSQYPHDGAFVMNKDGNNVLGEYENSIRYTDLILFNVYKMISSNKNTVMVYCSDHGERPGKLRLEDDIDYKMFRVPALFYFSQDLKNMKSYLNLKGNNEKYWSNELLFNSLCSICGVSNNTVLVDSLDICSDKYSLTSEFFNFVSGRYKMCDDNYIKRENDEN